VGEYGRWRFRGLLVTRRARDDQGVTVVLLALLLVVLLGFAAFAVDMGGLYNERRQDQSTADAAALAGMIEFESVSAATAEAIGYAERNIGAAPGELDFNSCPTDDPDRLAVTAPGASCITFNSSHTRIRVRLPTREHSATFARVLGADSFSHSAVATAERARVGFGGVLPFGIPSLGGGGGLICPASTPPGAAFGLEPCEGQDSGNFGFLDVGIWQGGVNNPCPPGGGTTRIAPNTAMGSDHRLEIHTLGDPLRTEADNCPDGAAPNALGGEQGNTPNKLGEGLYTEDEFRDGDPGRLIRRDDRLFGGATTGWPRRLTRDLQDGQEADVTPLWYFISETLPANAPSSCERDVFVHSDGSPRYRLQRCRRRTGGLSSSAGECDTGERTGPSNDGPDRPLHHPLPGG
jgi:hypothetical protein